MGVSFLKQSRGTEPLFDSGFRKTAVKVYFHKPEQFLDLSGRMGYKIYLGEVVQAQISVQDNHQLDRILENGERTCSDHHYDNCIYDMLAREMQSRTEDNCTVPWVLKSSRICTKPHDINTTFWIAWNRVTNQKKDCMIPCHSLQVTVGGKNYQNTTKTKGYLYLYFAPRVPKSTEHFLYTFLSLIAEIGGYVGLLLGYSLFNLAAWTSDLIQAKIKDMEERGRLERERSEMVDAKKEVKTISF